ncbi:hypothetical protein DFH06DRAFT_1331367 [Mycena polygramma]|nr:hypothetical protein DFH06DRAFT_1331367 [Mycena polygramma]
MRPLDYPIPRLICTLAPPPTNSKSFLAAAPVLVARNRTKVDGSLLLVSSSSVPDGPRKGWLGPARELIRYASQETRQGRDVSLDVAKAIRRYSDPVCPTNVAALGAVGKPYFSLRPRLSEMLRACLQTPGGRRGLFEADVVAERETITKLMFPYKAKFNASFAHGVLFLEEAEDTLKVDVENARRQLGFIRACTRMYAPEQQKPSPEPQMPRGRPTLYSVVLRQLGGLNLLVSGSVDCINSKDSGDSSCYMQLVTRPLKDGKYVQVLLVLEWYIRAHVMGVPSLHLGLIDEGGVLRNTRRLAMCKPPAMEAATDGVPWDPEENIGWAARVLNALRDYLQEAADLEEVVSKGGRAPQAVWRVEISPVGGEVRLLVRALNKGESYRTKFVPEAVLKAFEKEAWI